MQQFCSCLPALFRKKLIQTIASSIPPVTEPANLISDIAAIIVDEKAALEAANAIKNAAELAIKTVMADDNVVSEVVDVVESVVKAIGVDEKIVTTAAAAL